MPLYLNFEALRDMSGYKDGTPAQIAAWLRSKRIPFETGAYNRPFTTIDAVNSVLGVNTHAHEEEKPVVEI